MLVVCRMRRSAWAIWQVSALRASWLGMALRLTTSGAAGSGAPRASVIWSVVAGGRSWAGWGTQIAGTRWARPVDSRVRLCGSRVVTVVANRARSWSAARVGWGVVG